VLIDTGSRMSVFGGYLLGAALMVLAGLVAWRWGVAAERKPLEMVPRPQPLGYRMRAKSEHWQRARTKD
jgi:hypothetical protein